MKSSYFSLRVHVQIVHIRALKLRYRNPFKAQVYTVWVHGPFGFEVIIFLKSVFRPSGAHELRPVYSTQNSENPGGCFKETFEL